VGLGEGAVPAAAADGDVEFAGQVLEFPAQQREGCGHRLLSGVQELIPAQPGHGAAGDIAEVVHTRLLAGEPGLMEALEELRHLCDFNPAQLNVLAGGEVPHSPAKVSRKAGQGPQLVSIQEAIGNAHAQHEVPWRLFAMKQAVPF
jgi:hypothetical protein